MLVKKGVSLCLPIGPLREQFSCVELGSLSGLQPRTWSRWNLAGWVPLDKVDLVLTRSGLHLAIMYGSDYRRQARYLRFFLGKEWAPHFVRRDGALIRPVPSKAAA